MDLIDSLIENNYLKTPEIIKAFRKIKRADFMPEESKGFAEENEAFSIGYGQTISQPLVVAFMIEKLKPQKGDKILDVGSGSGWTTALLSEIVGAQGKVIGIELIPELVQFGLKNAAKYNFVKKGVAEFICTDGSLGFSREAPFDKILCSAAAEQGIPSAWKEQLKAKGRIVTPVNDSIYLYIKKTNGEFKKKEFPGFIFVPLITPK
jgi:protein-L-isoaspartate(D-aspartate) O-methyltransferase